MKRKGSGIILILFVITEIVLTLELFGRILSIGTVQAVPVALIKLLLVFAIHYLMWLLKKYKNFFWFDLIFTFIWCTMVLS